MIKLLFVAGILITMFLLVAGNNLSHDSTLRKTIRKSTIELLGDMGTAQMEQEVQKRILRIVKSNKEKLESDTGISSSITEDDVKEYLELLKQELQKKT